MRFLIVLACALWAGLGPAMAQSSTKSKSKSSQGTSASKGKSSSSANSKSASSEKKATPTKADGPAKGAEKEKPKVENEVAKKEEPRPAAVSTVSIEEIAGFDQYPKQVQSLVQSALALTHLELRYMYGSHEPSNGGMDCSGTIYHVLHFQGLKDVPRQSDEMAMWVDRKTWLHLTPTATSFDSPEFADLKPGDMLFWTNTIATTRKLPVTHVMIYLGKLKGSGKRIVFGASDGRSYSGQRRSGVSVFDFNLPKAEGTARLHGYGRAPGLMPAEDVILAAAKAEAVAKAEADAKAAAMTATTANTTAREEAAVPPPPALAKTEPAKEAVVTTASPAAKTNATSAKDDAKAAVKTEAAADGKTKTQASSEAKEEVRKAVSVVTDSTEATMEEGQEFVPAYRKRVPSGTKAASSDADKASVPVTEPAIPKTAGVEESPAKAGTPSSAAASSKTKSTTTAAKAKTSSSGGSSAKKKSTTVSSRKRTPPPPAKSAVGQTVDRAVDSMKRLFR